MVMNIITYRLIVYNITVILLIKIIIIIMTIMISSNIMITDFSINTGYWREDKWEAVVSSVDGMLGVELVTQESWIPLSCHW